MQRVAAVVATTGGLAEARHIAECVKEDIEALPKDLAELVLKELTEKNWQVLKGTRGYSRGGYCGVVKGPQGAHREELAGYTSRSSVPCSEWSAPAANGRERSASHTYSE